MRLSWHDHENDRRVGLIRQKEGQSSGRQEDEDDRTGESPKQQLVGGQPALRFQEKMRLAQMAPARLIAEKSLRDRFKLLEHFGR